MTTVNRTPAAVVPDKENAAEPSFLSAAGKQQAMNAILKPSKTTKNTPSSSNISNKLIKAGGVPLVIKPMNNVPAIVNNNNNQYTSTTLQALSNNVPAAAAVYNNVAVSHPIADHNNNEYYRDVEAETTQVDWKAESKELDEMFDDQNREKFRNVPIIAKPNQLVTTCTLFPHQVDGISWMVNQETKKPEDAIPPFYIQKSNGRYRCTLTSNRTQDKPPAPVRGGILADDMGLGKTMQTIGLILANPPVKNRGMKSKAGGPRCTLIVSPLMPMQHWKNEIAKVVKKNALKVATFHGNTRQSAITKVQTGSVDVVFTTYETLASHYQTLQDKLAEEAKAMINNPEAVLAKREPFLFDFEFWRVVLDEAQNVRNKTTKSFKAVMAVDAVNSWCLTGTPIVNKPDDIQPYFEFLGFEPFNDCKTYERYVTDLIKAKKGVGLRRLRTAVSFCTLRRSKETTDTQLPSKTVLQTTVQFGDNDHATTYEHLYVVAREIFIKQLNQEGGSRSIKHIWSLLTRLKQACNHAALVPKEVRDRTALAYEIRNESDDPAQMLAIMMPAVVESDDTAADQKVNAELGNDDDAMDVNIVGAVDPRSPKVEALLKSIREMKPDEKAVIFSQYKSFLNVLETALESENHTFTRIDGDMTSQKRQKAMEKFSTDACDSPETPRFILCSLKAAGVGITLTRANHVFMMDPWWNTSIENQAYDRVYRIGQTRPVRVVRFLMSNSVEERLVAVQEAKQALGNGSLQKLTKAEEEKAKLTTIRDLFEIAEADEDAWDWLD